MRVGSQCAGKVDCCGQMIEIYMNRTSLLAIPHLTSTADMMTLEVCVFMFSCSAVYGSLLLALCEIQFSMNP